MNFPKWFFFEQFLHNLKDNINVNIAFLLAFKSFVVLSENKNITVFCLPAPNATVYVHVLQTLGLSRILRTDV